MWTSKDGHAWFSKEDRHRTRYGRRSWRAQYHRPIRLVRPRRSPLWISIPEFQCLNEYCPAFSKTRRVWRDWKLNFGTLKVVLGLTLSLRSNLTLRIRRSEKVLGLLPWHVVVMNASMAGIRKNPQTGICLQLTPTTQCLLSSLRFERSLGIFSSSSRTANEVWSTLHWPGSLMSRRDACVCQCAWEVRLWPPIIPWIQRSSPVTVTCSAPTPRCSHLPSSIECSGEKQT